MMSSADLSISRTNLTIDLPDNDDDETISGDRIAHYIKSICSSIDSLSRNIAKVGTTDDSVRFRAKIFTEHIIAFFENSLNEQLVIGHMIESGSGELKNRNVEMLHGDPQQRHAFKQLALEFRRVVENYVMVQREMANVLKDPTKEREAMQHQVLQPSVMLLQGQHQQQDQLLRQSLDCMDIIVLETEEEPAERNVVTVVEEPEVEPYPPCNWYSDERADPLALIKQNEWHGFRNKLLTALIFTGLTIILLVGIIGNIYKPW